MYLPCKFKAKLSACNPTQMSWTKAIANFGKEERALAECCG